LQPCRGVHELYYSERIAYLPNSYFPSDDERAIAPAPSRREAGLPDEGMVFCAFNNVLKYMPEMFACWLRILAAVPGSVLWLPQLTESAQQNLRREAEAAGITPNRIVFAPFVERQEDHLARLSLADLFLDTLPFNAHSVGMSRNSSASSMSSKDRSRRAPICPSV